MAERDTAAHPEGPGMRGPHRFVVRMIIFLFAVVGLAYALGGPLLAAFMGNPAVNVALVPFNQKNIHNAGSPVDDANRRFWPGIQDTLQNFYHTDATSTAVFEDLIVKRGDYLRLDLTVPNTGTNPEAQFPNGRRLTDDVIDILMFLINNRQDLKDNVNGNDVPLRAAFPFLAPSQQPRLPGTADDNTRN